MLRTPLVRLDLGPDGPDIRLKLENLQPTNAYKIRGAANAVGKLTDAEQARGVWTVSAGNAGQGVAYAARAAAYTARWSRSRARRRPSSTGWRRSARRIVPVPYEIAWKAVTDHEFEGMDGLFIHPFDNHDFIAGHGTMGLEILEDAPDTRAVITAIGGGGLITGVGSAIKALRPDIKVFGAEPETAAPYALSRREGGPRSFPDWEASFVDGAGGQSVTERMWERMLPVVDGAIVVTLDQTRAGDAPARRESAGDRRGRRRAVAGGGPDRRGWGGADRLRHFAAAISIWRNSPRWSPPELICR